MYPKFTLIECPNVDIFWEKLSPEKPLTDGAHDFIYRGQSATDLLIPAVHRARIAIDIKRFWKGSPASCCNQVVYEFFLLDYFVKQCDALGLTIINDSSEFRKKYLSLNTGIINELELHPSRWPPDDLLDLMALAQHSGVPTRLLDWSRRSYIAAYFAASAALTSRLNGPADPKIAIWALNIELINLYRNIKIVRVPGSTSNNLAMQAGVFTLLKHPGNRDDPFQPNALEDEFSSLPNTPLWKITVPAQYSSDILHLCDLYGVSGATLFPGFIGAAKATVDNMVNS